MLKFKAAAVLAAAVLLAVGTAQAQSAAAESPSVQQWLLRLHEASRAHAYTGTFVVSSPAGTLSSSRIWHVCDGDLQMEQVDSLSGAARTTLRRNDQVMTFLPETRIARSERREGTGLFPNLLKASDHALGDFYTLRKIGAGRTAGYDADIVQLQPRDDWRFGYRIWSEKKSGLAIKLQTLGKDAQVLEQSAFSELQLDAPVQMTRLAQLMQQTEGWQVEKAAPGRATTPAAEGWSLRQTVPGFKTVGCYRRAATNGDEGALQWVFSDGLATVSLFIDGSQRRPSANETVMGATHSLVAPLPHGAPGWVTAVGEVPVATLRALVQNLERKR